MKKCPQCGREYDETMIFCLDDGSELLYGPVRARLHDDEPATAIFAGRASADEDGTGNSIAVLPFANISADPENEYFCDGLAEELLNALSKIEQLKVTARTSAFSFKGKTLGAAEIGGRLGVNNILEGSVRRSGDRLRVTVQLVNAADGFRVWSERYDRQMKDIFEVQDEIALAVVDALKLKLFGNEKADLLKKPTDDLAAYERYMAGRFFWNRRTHGDFQRAIEHFEEAIKIDPNYTLAYSGLADCLLFLGYYDSVPPAEAALKAKAAVEKALEMDPELADAHASMAMYHGYFEYDWARAEERLRKAIELNPKLSSARYWYCSLLDGLGRFDESVAQGREGLRSDPLNLITRHNIARTLFHAGRLDEATEIAVKTLEIESSFYVTYWLLGSISAKQGRLDAAIEHFERAFHMSGVLLLKGFLANALALADRTDEARRILAELRSESEKRYVSPLVFSVVYTGMGEIDKALDNLEKAWELRVPLMIWLKTEPIFDPLRGEQRFKRICEAMNLA